MSFTELVTCVTHHRKRDRLTRRSHSWSRTKSFAWRFAPKGKICKPKSKPQSKLPLKITKSVTASSTFTSVSLQGVWDPESERLISPREMRRNSFCGKKAGWPLPQGQPLGSVSSPHATITLTGEASASGLYHRSQAGTIAKGGQGRRESL